MLARNGIISRHELQLPLETHLLIVLFLARDQTKWDSRGSLMLLVQALDLVVEVVTLCGYLTRVIQAEILTRSCIADWTIAVQAIHQCHYWMIPLL
nr:hypothetical protein CFP56_19194 [Quercus suber]